MKIKRAAREDSPAIASGVRHDERAADLVPDVSVVKIGSARVHVKISVGR